MKTPNKGLAAVLASAAALLTAGVLAQSGTQTVNTTVAEQVSTNKAAAASQERVNKLDDETQRMLNDFRATMKEAESLRRYNEALELQIQSQKDEMVSIQQQIEEIERTNREIYPLMQRMIETLEQFVALDVPFLKQERATRVNTLKEIMARADVSTAEKFRRVLEAYQVEMEYGRTLEAYEDKLGDGEEARTVVFLRVGRIALLYQTLDGGETGFWNAETKAFEEDNGYDVAVSKGIKIARKQIAPDLLIAPVPAPKEINRE